MLFAHEGVGRDLVHALKFRSDRRIARWLATSMAIACRPIDIDVVAWVPASLVRRRIRGVDQGRLLARPLATAFRCRHRSLLRRPSGPGQAGLDRATRLETPEFWAPSAATGLRILLIDDVVTTGTTATRAVAALRAAGAAEVHFAACSRADRAFPKRVLETSRGAA